MTDVFLSYSRRDRAHAETLAAHLDPEFELWWDRDLLSGSAFVNEINDQLAKAKCILVLWSPDALKSRWVMAEAMEGFDSDRLVQVGLKVMPMVPFKILHCTVLDEAPSQTEIDGLKRAIRATIASPRSDLAAGQTDRSHSPAPDPTHSARPSKDERAQAIKEMDTRKFAGLMMGFSPLDLLLAVLLVALAAGIVVTNLVAPVPDEWINGSLIAAAGLCGLGVILMLKTTLSFFRTRG